MDGDGGMEEDDIDIGMRERSNTWHGSRVNYKELVPSFDTINEKASGENLSDLNELNKKSLKLPQPSSPLVLIPTTSKKGASRKNAWGSASYAELITEAIESTPDQRMTLVQIYEWMIKNIPYFEQRSDSTSSMGWKNSIRHNLSLHQQFCRVQKDGAGKSSWWVVNKDLLKHKPPRRRATMGEPLLLDKKRIKVNRKLKMEEEELKRRRKVSESDEKSFSSPIEDAPNEKQQMYFEQNSPALFNDTSMDNPSSNTSSFVVCSSIPLASPTFLLPVNFAQSGTTSNTINNNRPIIFCVSANLKDQLLNQLVLTDRVNQSETEQNNYQQQLQQQQQQQVFVQQNLPQQVFSLNNNLLSDLNRQTHNMTLKDHSPSTNHIQPDHTPSSNQHPPTNQSQPTSERFLTQSNESFNYQSHDSSSQPIKSSDDNLPEERKRALLSILHSESFCKMRRDNPVLNQKIIEMLHRKKELLKKEGSDRGITPSQKLAQTSLMSSSFHQPSIFSSAFHQQTPSHSSTSQQYPVFSTQPLQHNVDSKPSHRHQNEDSPNVTSSSLPPISQLSNFSMIDEVDSSMVGDQAFMQETSNKRFNNFEIDDFIHKLNANKDREEQLDTLNEVIFNDKGNLNKDSMAEIEDDSLLSSMDDTQLFLDDFSLFENLFSEDKSGDFLNDIKHEESCKNNGAMGDGGNEVT